MSDNVAMTKETKWRSASRGLPAWALGLMIAVVLFGIGIIVFQALGFGDNPVLGDAAATLRSL